LPWDLHELAGRLGQTLQDAENAYRIEQAVFGLDALDDLELHQLFVRGLSPTCSAQREVSTPATSAKRRNLRVRADLVLTPAGRPLRTSDEPDLFTPADACPPEEALWLNLRVIRQFPPLSNPTSTHGAAFRAALAVDHSKLIADARITDSALAVVVFSDTQETLGGFVQAIDADLALAGLTPADSAARRHVRSVSITDRLGHRLASVALWSTADPHPEFAHAVPH